MARDIQFTDTSEPAPGQTLTGWAWEFGEGGALGTSTDQHPRLTDAPDTAIPVTLTVTQDDDQSHTATETIPARVVDEAPTIAIDQGAGGSLEVGQTVQLTATATGEPAPSVTWSSSDEAIATVSAAGLVTAVAEGACTITATATNRAGSDSAGYALEVGAAAEPPAGIYYRNDFQSEANVALEDHVPTWREGAGIGAITKVAGQNSSTVRAAEGYLIGDAFGTPPPGYMVDVSSPDQEVVGLAKRLSTSYVATFYLRWDPAAQTHYSVRHNTTDGFAVYRVVAGASARIHKEATPTVWPAGETREIRYRIETVGGNPVISALVDGVEVMSYTDTHADKILPPGAMGMEHAGSSSHGLAFYELTFQSFEP